MHQGGREGVTQPAFLCPEETGSVVKWSKRTFQTRHETPSILYVMVALPPFMGSVVHHGGAGRHGSLCTKSALGCILQNGLFQNPHFVLFEKMCDFGESYQKNGKTSERL